MFFCKSFGVVWGVSWCFGHIITLVSVLRSVLKMEPWMSPLLDNFKHHFKDRVYFECMLEKGEIEIIEAPVVADVPVIAQEPPVIAQETLIEDMKPMEEQHFQGHRGTSGKQPKSKSLTLIQFREF